MGELRERGFTLAEILIVVAMMAVLARIAMPMLSSNNPQKLVLAAEETANALRFAVGEARRTGGYVLVDGKTLAGQLSLYYSDAACDLPPAAGTSAVTDPLTKRAYSLAVGASAFASGVIPTPLFQAGGSAQPQLLIGPGASLLQGCNGSLKGALQSGSGVQLSLGSQIVIVAVSEQTGLVTLP